MKTEIHISNLSKWFADKILLKNINLHIHSWEKIGIIGGNWCWKTTFLKLLSWEIKPDNWWIWNRNSIAYMKQEIVCKPETTVYDYLMQHIDHREEYKIYEMLEKYDVNIDINQKVQSLSWWEQKKVDLIAIILQKADVLLLDEPTNHLDQKSLDILQETIKQHKWIVLFVSHDRHFLNMMANRILEVDNSEITIFHGDYEHYKREKALIYERQLNEYTVYQKEKQKRETRLNDIRQRASVYVNPARWRLLRNKEKFFEREILSNKIDKPTKEKNIYIRAIGGTHQKKLILEIKNHSIGFWDKILIEDVWLEVRWHERIQITWANWSGKTTLIKNIVDCFDKWDKKNTTIWNNITFEYFDQQNQDLKSHETVFKRLYKNIKSSANEQSIISQLAMIWLSQTEIFESMDKLSYGQRVKVKFLQILSSKIDLLILDEPTNHLDINTRESIEDMLEDYDGSLIFVSHDQYFADKVKVNKKYNISDKKIEIIY